MLKYTFVLAIMATVIAISASFTMMPPLDHEFKNLKVLPKNITDEQLDSVMDHFKTSLGVKCNFCHAQAKDTIPKKHLDFASDSKPEKARAREMMKMTAYLNANFFNPEKSNQPDTIHQVICFTCHRGTKEPKASTLFPQLDSLMELSKKK